MAITYNNVAGMNPSTVDFRLAVVEINRGSSAELQELICIADPQSSIAITRVLAIAPTSTEYGMTVRIASGPSSGADLLMRPVFSSTSTDNPVRAVLSSTAADNPVRATFSSTGTDNPVQLVPGTARGCLTFHAVSANSDNATNIKTSAGQVYGIDVTNVSGAPVFVKFHNSTSTPTAGSGVVRSVGFQAGAPRHVPFPNGLAFSTGIGITIVTGIADNSTLRVGAADCVVDIEYI